MPGLVGIGSFANATLAVVYVVALIDSAIFKRHLAFPIDFVVLPVASHLVVFAFLSIVLAVSVALVSFVSVEFIPSIVGLSSLVRVLAGIDSFSKLLFDFMPSSSSKRLLQLTRIPALCAISSPLVVRPLAFVYFISLLIPIHFSVPLHFVIHPLSVVIFSISVAVLSLSFLGTSHPVTIIRFSGIKVGVLVLEFVDYCLVDLISFDSLAMGPSSLKVASVDVSIGPGVLTLSLLLVVEERAFIKCLVGVDDSSITVSLVVFPLSFIYFTSLLAEVDAITIEFLSVVSLACVLVVIIEFAVSNVVARL